MRSSTVRGVVGFSVFSLGFTAITASLAGCGQTPLSLPADLAMAAPPDLVMTDPGDSVTVTMDSFLVPAGAEVYKCQNFVNPFGGVDAEISAYESHMTAGSHHLLVFYKAGIAASGMLEDCSGLEFAPTPYGSQRRDDLLSFPPGVASLVPGTQGLRFQSHYLNATNQDLMTSVKVIFHKAKPGTVTDHAGVLFFVNTAINIPSTNMPVTISKSCKIPSSMNVIQVSSHMHQHATGFVATSDATALYQTSSWNEPTPALFNPPVKLAAGSSVDFSCTFLNNTGAVLTFGESAKTNEMCIFTGAYYPVVGKSSIVPCF